MFDKRKLIKPLKFDQIGLDWIGSDWIGSDWIRLDQTALRITWG